MKGIELIDFLKGKENWDILLNVKYKGKTVATGNDHVKISEISEYNKAFLSVDADTLNYGFSDDREEK